MLAAVPGLDRVFVSFDPAADDLPVPTGDGHGQRPALAPHFGLELLRDGLTFDCLGLGDGPGVDISKPRHLVGSVASPRKAPSEAIGLFPGPHLADGAHSLPVVRTQLSLAVDIMGRFAACVGAMWLPSASLIAADTFSRLVSGWLNGGPFPGPLLIGWTQSDRRTGRTDGLSFFLGRELELEAALNSDRPAAAKLALRLVHELVGRGENDFPAHLDFAGWPRIALLADDDAKLIRAVCG
ncbi:hypothetical protein K3172_08860 [Qipengyuania sp. 6B39]|uniref:hypothetical protein n=1 Tax=Qipengyuania proteolytica TaxID=2867239 RepID=UPI001C892BE7|nr:hypothetical protein [Qipengyuania proteolytica]MBX7495959.1 hypothetical protein [Qipengyuania proteolytica]